MKTVGGRVVASVDTADRRRIRSVLELDNSRIALVGHMMSVAPDRPMEPLFEPVSVTEAYEFALKILAGQPAAINHPKGHLVLASVLVAILETVNQGAPHERDEPEH